jgi:hypothetical protein
MLMCVDWVPGGPAVRAVLTVSVVDGSVKQAAAR